MFLAMDKSGFDHISIRLASKNPADWQTTLAQIEQHWNRIYTESNFGYFFYDKTIELFYQEEQTVSNIIDLATSIAILISCLGLFGLVTLTAYQRTKEIGIRKVLGASVTGIVVMLSKDVVNLVILAIVIATPLAWYAMRQWLQDFEYKIDMEWWMFALAGVLAIGIALLTVSFQSIKAALMNPVKSLKTE